MGDLRRLFEPIARALRRRHGGDAGGRSADRIRFIFGAVCPPFLFRDAAGGLVGFEADLAKALSAELGLGCRFVPRLHEVVFQTLLAGEGDAIIAGLENTPARRRIVAFTDSYMNDYPRFVARKGFDRPLTAEGLRGLRIGVVAGSEDEATARKRFGSTAEIVPLSGEYDVVPQAMRRGTVDVGFSFFLTLYPFTSSPLGKDFALIDEPVLTPTPFHIAVRKEDAGLLERLNNALAQLRADGRLETIRAKWMPFSI